MSTSTPWGASQHVYNICRGVRSVSTAGHGGILVSPTMNAKIPEYMRYSPGEYEEDCDWCIPAIVFEKEWREWSLGVNKDPDHQMQCAYETLKTWHPDAYEKFTGNKLAEGDSLMRDKMNMEAQLHDKLVARAAFGDWKDGVPKGMVAVIAKRVSDSVEKSFLVDSNEYETRNYVVGKAREFVIDESRHEECDYVDSVFVRRAPAQTDESPAPGM